MPHRVGSFLTDARNAGSEKFFSQRSSVESRGFLQAYSLAEIFLLNKFNRQVYHARQVFTKKFS